ncbi:hypothetical protein [Lyticum sinuosum]|nr:hypothetical protein [Lyticum sinuosum]
MIFTSSIFMIGCSDHKKIALSNKLGLQTDSPQLPIDQKKYKKLIIPPELRDNNK